MVWADCDVSDGILTWVDPPCPGVGQSQDGYNYNTFELSFSEASQTIVQKGSASDNQSDYWVKVDNSSWLSLGSGRSFNLSGPPNGNHTFQVCAVIVRQGDQATAAVNVIPTGHPILPVGWQAYENQ
jgi:hypothetical protein